MTFFRNSGAACASNSDKIDVQSNLKGHRNSSARTLKVSAGLVHKLMSTVLAIAFCVIAAAQISTANAATTIDTTGATQSDVSPWGPGGSASYGQVITVPAGETHLNSFSFLLRDVNGVADYQAHVYEWDSGTNNITGSALFTSSPATTSGSLTTNTVTTNTGGIAVEAGKQYVLFFTVVGVTQNTPAGGGGADTIWRIVSGTTYTDGHFVLNNNTATFNGSWSVRTEDLAFVVNFSNVVKETSGKIAAFLKRRNDLLLQSEPSNTRQIDRLKQFSQNHDAPSSNLRSALSGSNTGDNTTGQTTSRLSDTTTSWSNAGNTAGGSPSSQFKHKPFDRVAGGTGKSLIPGLTVALNGLSSLSFSTSMQQLRQQTAAQKNGTNATKLGARQDHGSSTTPSPFDIWVEGRLTRFNDDTTGGQSKGHFGVIYVGADYVLSPNFLFGALVQYDHMEDTSEQLSSKIDGRGWMIGPYTTIKFAPNLFFQGRVAVGRSKNDISPLMTYTDRFETSRMLARGELTGEWNYGPLKISPTASVAFIREKQKGYTDSGGNQIASQTVSLGQAEFGPEFSYTKREADGTMIVPMFAIKGVWNFDSDDVTVANSEVIGPQNFRGKTEAGVRIVNTGGAALELLGSYDGIGDSDYQAVSARANFRVRF